MSLFQTGYLTVGRVWGAPLRLHWSVPLGAVLLGGMSPAFWVAFFGLVTLHELGHAYLVRRFRHHLVSIDVTGFGGLCRWEGWASEREHGVIAWGGVAAQALVLIPAAALFLLLGWPRYGVAGTLSHVLVTTNAMIIALNLLPFPPFDGQKAWGLVRSLLNGRRPRYR